MGYGSPEIVLTYDNQQVGISPEGGYVMFWKVGTAHLVDNCDLGRLGQFAAQISAGQSPPKFGEYRNPTQAGSAAGLPSRSKDRRFGPDPQGRMTHYAQVDAAYWLPFNGETHDTNRPLDTKTYFDASGRLHVANGFTLKKGESAAVEAHTTYVPTSLENVYVYENAEWTEAAPYAPELQSQSAQFSLYNYSRSPMVIYKTERGFIGVYMHLPKGVKPDDYHHIWLAYRRENVCDEGPRRTGPLTKVAAWYLTLEAKQDTYHQNHVVYVYSDTLAGAQKSLQKYMQDQNRVPPLRADAHNQVEPWRRGPRDEWWKTK
jgi:hypothetical protein